MHTDWLLAWLSRASWPKQLLRAKHEFATAGEPAANAEPIQRGWPTPDEQQSPLSVAPEQARATVWSARRGETRANCPCSRAGAAEQLAQPQRSGATAAAAQPQQSWLAPGAWDRRQPHRWRARRARRVGGKRVGCRRVGQRRRELSATARRGGAPRAVELGRPLRNRGAPAPDERSPCHLRACRPSTAARDPDPDHPAPRPAACLPPRRRTRARARWQAYVDAFLSNWMALTLPGTHAVLNNDHARAEPLLPPRRHGMSNMSPSTAGQCGPIG